MTSLTFLQNIALYVDAIFCGNPLWALTFIVVYEVAVMQFVTSIA